MLFGNHIFLLPRLLLQLLPQPRLLQGKPQPAPRPQLQLLQVPTALQVPIVPQVHQPQLQPQPIVPQAPQLQPLQVPIAPLHLQPIVPLHLQPHQLQVPIVLQVPQSPAAVLLLLQQHDLIANGMIILQAMMVILQVQLDGSNLIHQIFVLLRTTS